MTGRRTVTVVGTGGFCLRAGGIPFDVYDPFVSRGVASAVAVEHYGTDDVGVVAAVGKLLNAVNEVEFRVSLGVGDGRRSGGGRGFVSRCGERNRREQSRDHDQ